MDEAKQVPNQNPVTPVPPISTYPIPQPVPTSKTPWILIFLIVFLAGVASYFGFQTYQLRQEINKQTDDNSSDTEIVVFSPSPLDSPQPSTATLPSGWKYTTADSCDVSFAIPPKQKPYLGATDSRFWDFPRGATYPNMLAKVVSYESIKQAVTMYGSTEEASGYIAQSVSVSCSANNGQFANNTDLVSKLTTAINKHNQSTAEKGMEANTYTITTQKISERWSQQVIDLTVQEDSRLAQYTIFVTPKYIYEVKLFGDSDDSFIKQTGKQIFDLLQF